MDKSDIAHRMKAYEFPETSRKFMPHLPIVIRLDGRNFSKLTKNFDRPFDMSMIHVMQCVTKDLCEETNALIGYTQSDEISLILYTDKLKTQVYFNGKIFKIVSGLAAKCSVLFNKYANEFLSSVGTEDFMATFDCRAFQVPSKIEAVNALMWREFDATKNSISALAQSQFSHKDLMNKNSGEKQDMLHSIGINWNDYQVSCKRGSYIQKLVEVRRYTNTELEKLPIKHLARTNPDLEIERTDFRLCDMPPISTVYNRVEVVFENAEPMVKWFS